MGEGCWEGGGGWLSEGGERCETNEAHVMQCDLMGPSSTAKGIEYNG